MNLSELGVNSSVYINDSWCNYYKMLWGKCRKLLLKKYISSNVNEVIKTILDFFIQKNIFLKGPKKLFFDRMYGSTIFGVVGPPYPYCLLVAFRDFAWLRLCAFLVILVLLVRAKSFRKKKK